MPLSVSYDNAFHETDCQMENCVENQFVQILQEKIHHFRQLNESLPTMPSVLPFYQLHEDVNELSYLYNLFCLSGFYGFYGFSGQLYLTMEVIPLEWNLMLRIGSETPSGILFASVMRISGSSNSSHHLFGFYGLYGFYSFFGFFGLSGSMFKAQG
jgi:hypothetical protein